MIRGTVPIIGVMMALTFSGSADAQRRRDVDNGGGRVSATGMRPAARIPHAPTKIVQPTPAAVSVMGMDEAGLSDMFGAPRIARQDGPARHVQFANDRCLLDLFLFPPSDDRAPRVVHYEAHDLDGRDTDAAACLLTLQWRR